MNENRVSPRRITLSQHYELRYRSDLAESALFGLIERED